MLRRLDRILRVFGALAIALLIGCGGDITSGVGENGLLRYSIYSAYEIDEGNIKDARIITGHPQVIDVSMTTLGRAQIGNPSFISHQFDPAEGVSVFENSTYYENSEYVQSARFTVNTAGTYTLESLDGTEVVDHIDLDFEAPGGFEMSMKVRDQWGDDFVIRTGNPVPVDEGDQVIILSIPVDSSNGRLAGTMTPDITVDPHWAVTPGHNVWSNTEDVTWEYDGAPDYYFIEPGIVTFTVSDPVSGASTDQSFSVLAVDQT